MDTILDTNELLRKGTQALRRELGQDNADRFISLLSSDLTMQEASPGHSAQKTQFPSTPAAEAMPSVVQRAPEHQLHQQYPLFPMDEQPWTSPPARLIATEEQKAQRSALLEGLANSELGTIESKVAWVLQHFPETRNSDTSLTIRYWMQFQAQTLEKHDIKDLTFLYELDRIGSMIRSRQHVQNTLCMFQGTPFARKRRGEAQKEFHEYLITRRDGDPEVRFYLDETGTDRQGRFAGVGGICVIDYRQYEMHHAAIKNWRDEQGWVETIHFADLDQATIPRATKLLQQLKERRGGLMFIGYIWPIRSATHGNLAALFSHLIVDAITRLRHEGCLNIPKAITVYKEAEDGFDRVQLESFRDDLAAHLARDHENVVYLREVKSLSKGREVLLECADLIASGMQRRALYGGRNPKDRLAEAVVNVTGFEDSQDGGALYKTYAP